MAPHSGPLQPAGYSINDGIDKELSTVEYPGVDDVARCIAVSGRGTLLAKMDIASAYCIVPIHPNDRLLLAMRSEGQVYFETRLPLG